ncbi:MAG: S8 family serine peptidase [Saprospiraceae bacterium]|nr:S8 family serine peptidase [Saprospiraceae bacterium]MDZ4706716.1 S8 family serine peptidase [Saprospiraceae bacterium]
MTPLCSFRPVHCIIILILFVNFLPLDQAFAQNPNDCQTFSASYVTENVTCPGAEDGKATLQLTPAGTNPLPAVDELSFKWSLPSIENIPNPEDLGVGNYSVTITYTELSCSLIVKNILIKEPLPLAINCFVVNDVGVPGGQDGLAKVDCSNGRSPYSIFWAGPQSGSLVSDAPGLNSLNNLSAGAYSVTVTDGCGPMQSCNFVIKEPLCDDLVDVETTDPTCNDVADGMITFTPNPLYNNRTFAYQWLQDSVSTIAPSRTLSAGQYTVIVTDNTGCKETIAETLVAPLAMTIQIDEIKSDTFNKYGEQGQVRGHIVNGFPPYDILWSGSPSGSTFGVNNPNFAIQNLKKGSYSINATDNKGCEAQADVFVGEIFFIEDNLEFIIDYTQVLDKTTIPPFMDTLLAKGAHLIDTCHCIGGMWLLQHWRNGPDDIIIIDNTPPQGAQSTTKSDDNGWFGGITTPKQEDTPIVGQENCKYRPGQGTGQNHHVKVAIIDSGANLRYQNKTNSGHPALTGLDWVNEESNDLSNCIAGDVHGYDFVNKTSNVIDNVGHGTHIAGAIAHAFPKDIGMKLMNLKVYDKKKQGNVFGLACAIHYAVNHQAQIINMSLGYYSKHPFEPLYNALHRADSANILVVMSAGNNAIDIDGLLFNQADSLRWPASFKAQNIRTKDGKPLPSLKSLLTVASAAEPGENYLVASYSNWGKTLVDIATNGLNTSPYLDTSYVTLKGTSMATANVSREAALMRAYKPLMTAEDIIKNMRNAPLPFSGNTSKGITAIGALDIDGLYRSIPINIEGAPVERMLVHPPRSAPSVSLKMVKSTTNVGNKYYMRLGDGSIFYDDVEVIITQSPTLDTIYKAKFCSANGFTWFGQDTEGRTIRDKGKTYFISITINGLPTTPKIMPVNID